MHGGIRDGFSGSVGGTPLIRIRSLSEATGCTILGKAEHLNPGGSVKDRAARFIVERAEAEGALAPGGTIVEGTAGNTGIGLAFMARAGGYGCHIVMPETMSPEKVELLRALGARVELVPPAPFSQPGNYCHVAKRRAAEIPGGFFADQFENPANFEAHYVTTGPELWTQTQGRLDGVILAAGTGGTIGGVTAYLKERRPDLATWLIDPPGSGLHDLVHTGTIGAQGSSITEGIGILRETANFRRARLDSALRGTDREAVEMAHFLLARDGLFLGASAALNCVGAVRLARRLGRGSVVATILCDGGARYQSRLYDAKWLSERDLMPSSHGLEFLG
jgi:cysteine synthase A